jgi:hypothetical protein
MSRITTARASDSISDQLGDDRAGPKIYDFAGGGADDWAGLSWSRPYSVIVCGEGLGGVPAGAWRVIELVFPEQPGRPLSFVFVTEPADPAEVSELTWFLQVAAGRLGFTITVIDERGVATDAPAIPPAAFRRAGRP